MYVASFEFEMIHLMQLVLRHIEALKEDLVVVVGIGKYI
jgi:hypothetical protein